MWLKTEGDCFIEKLIEGLSFRDYQGLNAVNKSLLDLVHQSPQHARYSLENRHQRTETESLIVGRAFHTLVLEPHLLHQEFSIYPSDIDRRTKRGKEEYAQFIEEAAGRGVLSETQYVLIDAMRYSLLSHKKAAGLLSQGKPEVTFLATEPETGLEVKGRIDFLTDSGILVDVKTTDNASPERFIKSCLKYRYHVQAAFYSDGYKLATGEQPKGFVFIVVEKSAPYGVALYAFDSQDLDLGRHEYIKDMKIWGECLEKKEWPCYGDGGVMPLRLPYWYFKEKGVEIYE